MARSESVVSAARLIAVCTLVSRVTGLARDMLMTQVFAITWVYDAFNYAFLIPNLFRRLFGEGALSAAFVPTFTQALEREGRASAWRMLARTLALLTVALCVIVILIEAAVLIGATLAASDNMALTLKLTALMTPFMLTICIVALFSSILNCLGSFVPAALAPVVLNLGMIAGVLISGGVANDDPRERVIIVAISVIVAGVAQIALLIPALRRRGAPLGWRWEPRDPQVRRMLSLMAPIAIGQGVLLLSTFLDAQLCLLLTRAADGPAQANWFGLTFAYPLEPGALSALSVAQRLYQFPLGVLGISLAVSALPTFTRLVAREDWPQWRTESRNSFRLAAFLGLLSGVLMWALAEPIVRMLFQYRQFSTADTARVAPVLAWYGVGMWAFCANHIVLRMFYSLADVRTPLRVSMALVPVNLALSVGLVWIDGVRESAFAISTTVTSTLSVMISLLLLRRKRPQIMTDPPQWLPFTRLLIAATLGGCGAWLSWRYAFAPLAERIDWSVASRGVETFGPLLLGTGLIAVVAALLGAPQPREALAGLRRRRTPAPRDASG